MDYDDPAHDVRFRFRGLTECLITSRFRTRKRFMLNQEKLTEQEQIHLLHCKKCIASMADGTLKYLEAEEKPEDREGSN